MQSIAWSCIAVSLGGNKKNYVHVFPLSLCIGNCTVSSAIWKKNMHRMSPKLHESERRVFVSPNCTRKHTIAETIGY